MMERSQQQQHKSTSAGEVEKAAAAAGETSSSSQHDEVAAARTAVPAVAQEDSRAQTNDDPLAKALQTLFLNVTSFIQAELQATSSEFKLLENLNLRVASEYDHQADFAAGLRVFVERLKQKNNNFAHYLQQIDEIDQEVTELEAVVSTLDNYTSNLEAKIKVACSSAAPKRFT
jgi:biogenesis of lysosome-related organelles complex 1 subunit 2